MRLSEKDFLAQFPNHPEAKRVDARSRRKPPAPREPSTLEATLLLQLRAYGLTQGLVQEHRFHPTRRWRMDFAWPDLLIAAEVEGGVWTQGRHTRAQGFIGDTHKYNHATLLGWSVLRFTEKCIKNGQAALLIKKLMDKRQKNL